MNYIDLSCPAEIFRTAMPTEEVPAATVTLFNLSDRVIVSAEVLLRLLDEDGGETERLAYRGRALNGRPHSTFLMTVPCAPAEDLHSIIFTKVFDPNDQLNKDTVAQFFSLTEDFIKNECSSFCCHPGYVDAELLGLTTLSLERAKDAQMMMLRLRALDKRSRAFSLICFW